MTSGKSNNFTLTLNVSVCCFRARNSRQESIKRTCNVINVPVLQLWWIWRSWTFRAFCAVVARFAIKKNDYKKLYILEVLKFCSIYHRIMRFIALHFRFCSIVQWLQTRRLELKGLRFKSRLINTTDPFLQNMTRKVTSLN